MTTNHDLFKLKNIPERPNKPRENGITMVMDKGLSTFQAASLAESGEHIIDLVKLGFGTSLVTPKLKEKIAIYKQAGLDIYLGGTLFEAYLVRDQIEDYKRLIDNLGISTIEISDGSISLEHEKKCELISQFAKNYKVLSEVGSKDAEKIIPPYAWIEMMENELEAGAWKVVAESRESGTVGVFRGSGEIRTGLVAEIERKINIDNVIWEAPQKSQQVWFIKLYGSNINLGNIAVNEVSALEALRLGLRGDSFDFFI
jgi:phosphosulfolactate synthase